MGNFSRACFISLFVVGCGGDPGNAGDDGTDPQPDASGDQPVCTESSTCSAEQPHCVGGNCVECRDANDCPAERPVCGNNQCVASCAGDELQADFVSLPSDIIFVVDQSGSMDQETQYVQAKINDFAAAISASNIDYRVVMIARTTGNNSGNNRICVPAPLSDGSCGNNTRFRLVNQYIDSHNGPTQLVSRYSQYSDFLRLDAMKHIIFITDDDASNPSTAAATLTTALANVTPAGMFANYKVHGIYSYNPSGSGNCSGAFGAGAAEGTVYTTLVNQTSGARGVICNDDWTTVFNEITEAVVSGSQVGCELNVPAPPQGQTLDPDKVNVSYQSGVAPGSTLPRVQDAAACGSNPGWYYDNNTAPMTITLCPTTCTQVQGDAGANVKVEIGCATQIF